MTCKFCGSHNQCNHIPSMSDYQCPDCGMFQRLKYKTVRHLGHKWYDVLPINGSKHNLVRVSWLGELRQRGYVATVIDYPASGIVN